MSRVQYINAETLILDETGVWCRPEDAHKRLITRITNAAAFILTTLLWIVGGIASAMWIAGNIAVAATFAVAIPLLLACCWLIPSK